MVTLNIGAAETRFGDVNVDIRKEAFDTNHKGACIVADAGYLPFKHGVFGYIYASNVLEHLTVHPYDALNELSRITRLGGIIHVVSPTSNFRITLNETIAMPWLMLGFINRKKFKKAKGVFRHFTMMRARLHGAETGFGGHRWLLPWGWKLYYRQWFPFKLRGWEGLHVLYEVFYYKNYQSPDGEESGVRMLKENEVTPPPEKQVTYEWY